MHVINDEHMKLARISILAFLLLAPSFSFGQSIPPALKQLAKSDLPCSDPGIYSDRIGPAKRGYVATCNDIEIAVYEKTRTDFRRIFRSDMPMRAQWSFSKRASKGYFDFGWIVMGNSGGVCAATYRWNGGGYILFKEKCDD